MTEKQAVWQRIQQRFNKGVVKYGLIEDGDKILVGLSGGKDSLALLHLLALRARIFKPRFEVIALHVGNQTGQYVCDMDYLRRFAADLGISFHETSIAVEPDPTGRKNMCFLCSWSRRKALFAKAKELGCNKIALGHHMDDILQTYLLNITFEGNNGTMRPLLKMDKFDMTLIRPLCLVHEADLEQLARLRHYPQQLKRCPWERETARTQMKHVLADLERINPEARYSLWRACMREGE